MRRSDRAVRGRGCRATVRRRVGMRRVIVRRLVQAGRHVVGRDHHQPAVRGDDVDRCGVQRGERRRRHHLVRWSEPEAAARQVQHLVDVVQHGVDLVRHEDHRRAVLPAALIDQRRHLLLVAQVEGREWFVADQQGRIAGQRLRDADPLQFAAGEHRNGGIGEGGGADRRQHLVHRAPGLPPSGTERQSDAPVMSVDTHPHHVSGLDHGARNRYRPVAARSRRRRCPWSPVARRSARCRWTVAARRAAP